MICKVIYGHDHIERTVAAHEVKICVAVVRLSCFVDILRSQHEQGASLAVEMEFYVLRLFEKIQKMFLLGENTIRGVYKFVDGAFVVVEVLCAHEIRKGQNGQNTRVHFLIEHNDAE